MPIVTRQDGIDYCQDGL